MRIFNLFALARKLMARQLRIDQSLRNCYVANIAMFLHDRFDIIDHNDRNEGASDLLDRIFEG